MLSSEPMLYTVLNESFKISNIHSLKSSWSKYDHIDLPSPFIIMSLFAKASFIKLPIAK